MEELKKLTPEEYVEKCVFGDGYDDPIPAVADILNQISSKKKPEFDENGLSYDLDFLNEIGYGIAILPTDLTWNFVDSIAKNAIDSNDPCVSEWLADIDVANIELGSINATSIGNMAYAYEYTENEELKAKAKQWLTAVALAVLAEFNKEPDGDKL